MATVKVHRSVTYTLEHEGRTFELEFQPDDYDEPLVQILPDGRAVVGYLVHDDDCSHPLEDCDGCGKIHRGYRDAGKEERERFLEALGQHEYDDEYSPKRESNPYAVKLDVYIHGGEVWAVAATRGSFPDERWDVSSTAGVWVPDDSALQHMELTAAGKLLNGDEITAPIVLRALQLPPEHAEPFAITLRYHDKDEVKRPESGYTYGYTLWDGRKRDNYKTPFNAMSAAAKAAGIPAPEKGSYVQAVYAEGVVCADQATETYNSWISGDCYGIVVETFQADGSKLDDSDSCWGYIGRDYAEEELTATVANTVAYLLKPKTAEAT